MCEYAVIAARTLGEALSESGDLTDEIIECNFLDGPALRKYSKSLLTLALSVGDAFEEQVDAERLDGLLQIPAFLSKVGNERRAWNREHGIVKKKGDKSTPFRTVFSNSWRSVVASMQLRNRECRGSTRLVVRVWGFRWIPVD